MSEIAAQHHQHEWFVTFAAFGLGGEEVDAFLTAKMSELDRSLSGNSRGLSWAISVLQGDNVATWIGSSPEALVLDSLQRSFEEGPALAAIIQGEFAAVADVRLERRWPGYASVLASHEVLSVISVPLDPEGLLGASINVYAPEAHAFSSHDIMAVHRHAGEIARSLRLAIQVSGKKLAVRPRTLVGVASSVGASEESQSTGVVKTMPAAKNRRASKNHPATGKTA